MFAQMLYIWEFIQNKKTPEYLSHSIFSIFQTVRWFQICGSLAGSDINGATSSGLKVPWHQKVLICNMMKNGVYSTKKLKFYMYFKY